MKESKAKETIIVAPGLNSKELFSTLPRYDINRFNFRIMDGEEFARTALMRSGISIKEEIISYREEKVMIAKAIEGEKYFERSSYSDIAFITATINQMRGFVCDGDEVRTIEEKLKEGPFEEKNAALLNVYNSYMEQLEEGGMIDAVTMMRKAISEADEIQAKILALEEFPLDPLEYELVSKISGGHAKTVKLQELFEVPDSKIKIDGYSSCYGAANEVETIIDDIYSNNSLDECAVAISDISTYSQLFFDYAVLYDIPVTFGCGIPIMNANPAKLLVLYQNWCAEGIFGSQEIKDMLGSEAFNRSVLKDAIGVEADDFKWGEFYGILYDLKLTNNREKNNKILSDYKKMLDEKTEHLKGRIEKEYKKYEKKKEFLPQLTAIAAELALPVEEFLLKYSYIRRAGGTSIEEMIMKLDDSAIRTIYNEIKIVKEAEQHANLKDVISGLEGRNVASRPSEPGKLHITGISDAIASIRKNMYIAGLTAKLFPGAPKENRLLLDADIEYFDAGAKRMLSEEIIIEKKNQFHSMIHLASALGSSIKLSYAGNDVSELKMENPSSVLFDLFREENGKNATMEELEKCTKGIGYFEPAISKTREIGKAYLEGNKFTLDDGERDSTLAQYGLEREYSPSALETFFKCPRQFMLKYLFDFKEPDKYDEDAVLAPNERGSLAHLLMEELAVGGKTKGMTEEDFLALAEKHFDWMMAEKPHIGEVAKENEKQDFLEMMKTAYAMEPNSREVPLKEEELHCEHDSGIKLHGLADRLEKLKDGTHIIVDFKSGNTQNHKEDDIETCLQVLVYAYIMEKNGYEISGCEYRYINLNKVVTCKYDEGMKAKLAQKIQEFKEHLESGEFELLYEGKKEKDVCNFCIYDNVCGKKKGDK